MRKNIIPAILVGTLFCCSAKAETIFEAMAEAYRSNPDLQAQRAYLRAVDENVAIAKSGYRPTVALTGQYSNSNRDSNINPAEDGSVNTSYGATVSQPLFSGFSTVNSVKSADSASRSEQYNLSNYEQTIFLSASEASQCCPRRGNCQFAKKQRKIIKKTIG